MRVLHSLNLLLPGGVERLRASLILATSPRLEHAVICVEIQDHNYANAWLANVAFIRETGVVSSPLNPLRYRLAAELFRDWQPDIVHGAVIEGYTLAAIAGRLARVPVIIMEETSDPTTRSWRGHLLARLCAALSHHCIAVSPGVGRYLSDVLHVPASKITVINNGVEQPNTLPPEAMAALRSKLNIPTSHQVVGSVGRMHDDSVKRFADLIDAFARLRSDTTLLLVGDGCERTGLERHAMARGIRDRVCFVGFQIDVGPYYGLMDIFALASAHEAFGLVNAEAMRCSLPVVATNVGGIPDVVQDGVTGILVPPRNPTAMSAALQRLLDNPDQRQRMGDAGKTRADKHFSAERYANDITNLYAQLFNQHGR